MHHLLQSSFTLRPLTLLFIHSKVFGQCNSKSFISVSFDPVYRFFRASEKGPIITRHSVQSPNESCLFLVGRHRTRETERERQSEKEKRSDVRACASLITPDTRVPVASCYEHARKTTGVASRGKGLISSGLLATFGTVFVIDVYDRASAHAICRDRKTETDREK